MHTVTVSNPGDIATIVPRVIGFEPADSLVVLPVGTGGPNARVDLPPNDRAEYRALADALDAAMDYWRAARAVFLVVYTDDPGQFDYFLRHGTAIFQSVNLAGVIRIHEGRYFLADDPDEVGTPFVRDPDPVIAESREVLVERAAGVTDGDEAERLAIEAWHDGNGALAWCYIDRAEELHGRLTAAMVRLSTALEFAINPHTATCDEKGLPL